MHRAILLFLGIVVAAFSLADEAKFISAEQLQQQNPKEYAEAVAGYSAATAGDTTPLGWSQTFYSGITVSKWNTYYFSPIFNGVPSQGDPAKNITSLSYVAAPSYPLPGGYAPAISLLVYSATGALIGTISPLGASGNLTAANNQIPNNIPSISQFKFRIYQSGGGSSSISQPYSIGNESLSVVY